jgi:hypothetical protein
MGNVEKKNSIRAQQLYVVRYPEKTQPSQQMSRLIEDLSETEELIHGSETDMEVIWM